MKDDNKAKEVASDTVTARTTPATKAAYERLLEAMDGDSKTEKFKNLIRVAGEANAMTANTGDDRSEYEDFLLHTTRLNEIFNSLLTKKRELKDQIYLEFQEQIQSKDKMILDLQKQNEDLTSLCEDRESKISKMTPIVESVERYQEDRDKAIADADKAIKDADEMKSKLTDTIAAQSVQIQELQENLDDLPTVKEEKYQIERDCEKLQDQLKSSKEDNNNLLKKIEGMEERINTLQESLDVLKDEHRMEISRMAHDALNDKESAVEKAREKESQIYQKRIDELEAKRDAERKAYADDLKELEHLRMEKVYKTDPEIVSLKETVEKLEKELEKANEQLEKQKVQEDQKNQKEMS